MGYGLNPDLENILYRDERLKTCEDEHRNLNLEHLCLHYQFHGMKSFTEEQNSDFVQKIFKIIDDHKSNLNGKDDAQGILLARMDRRNLEPEIIEEEDTTKVFLKTKLTEEQKEISDTAQVEYDERFKYTALQLWSGFTYTKKYDSSKKYDDKPLLALDDIKNLIEELQHASGDIVDKFNRKAVINGCAKLVIEYSHLLSDDEKLLCKDVITSSLGKLFVDNYDYQINDGLESCTHALPILIEEYPDNSEELTLALIFILFNNHSIGAYKRICDYAVEATYDKDVWNKMPKTALSIMNGYIQLKPIYDKAVDALINRESYKFRHRLSKQEIFETFNRLLEEEGLNIELKEFNTNINQLNSFKIEDLETIYQLIPNDTKSEWNLAILNSTVSNIAETLLKDRREATGVNNLYNLRLNIFNKISALLLHRNSEAEIKRLLEPFLNNLKRNDETEQFIEQFILSEDEHYKPDNFWYVWKQI